MTAQMHLQCKQMFIINFLCRGGRARSAREIAPEERRQIRKPGRACPSNKNLERILIAAVFKLLEDARVATARRDDAV